MPKRVEILHEEEVFKRAIFRIDQATLRHERYDGSMSDDIVRLKLNRGDSVAALMHNQADDTIILTEQFRYPTYSKGQPWLVEIPAGMIDGDEKPEDAMRREIFEEIGYDVAGLKHISTFYLSPGGTSERIFLFYATITPKDQVGAGGGLPQEGEDVRFFMMKVNEALRKVESGELNDAKTIIGLQWLQLQRRL